MLEKSKKYKQAADNLVKRGLYCSAAHCLYYSCLHWMLNIVHTYNLQYAEESIHRGLIDAIFNDIQRQDKKQSLDFIKKIERLRHFRVMADYKDTMLSKEASQETMQLENSIKSILNHIYEVI